MTKMLVRLRRGVACTGKAILVCHLHRVAPTVTTVFEIVALASHLLPAGGGISSISSGNSGSGKGGALTLPARRLARPALALARGALGFAHGFAAAAVVAQAVRLAANLVREAEARRNQCDEANDKGTTEVRALQLGLSSVPRVDPTVPRALDEYVAIYQEWLLLLRGRLQLQSLELPPEVFDARDHELMRYALVYDVLQARSLKEALIAMDRTSANVRDFVGWWPKYHFLPAADLEAWARIAWWEGPDRDGHLWLMVDNRAAVHAARAHGADAVARVVVSCVEYGCRALVPAYGCRDTFNVVVDSAGAPAAAALRMRGAYQRVASLLERYYPSRLRALWLVNTPLPLRVATRTVTQFLRASTRGKIRTARPRDVPCRALPSALRSHKLAGGAVATAVEAYGFASGDDLGGGGNGAAVPSDFDCLSEMGPVTPAAAAAAARTPRFGGGCGGGGPGSVVSSGAVTRRRPLGLGGGLPPQQQQSQSQQRHHVLSVQTFLLVAFLAVLAALAQKGVLLPVLRSRLVGGRFSVAS